eukprot:scaffold201_cov405-Prasinococcus_capsulatus_cf.AAC.31
MDGRGRSRSWLWETYVAVWSWIEPPSLRAGPGAPLAATPEGLYSEQKAKHRRDATARRRWTAMTDPQGLRNEYQASLCTICPLHRVLRPA